MPGDHSADTDALCRRIVEQLETAILVYDWESRRVVHANGPAVELLRAFGDGPALGPVLRNAVARSSKDAEPHRFPRAMPIASERGQLFYLRAKYLSPGVSQALVTVAPHVARESRDKERHERLRRLHGLSPRQVEVVRYVCEGLTNEQIASRLELSVGTVKQALNRVYPALGVRSRAQLIVRLQQLERDDASGGESR